MAMQRWNFLPFRGVAQLEMLISNYSIKMAWVHTNFAPGAYISKNSTHYFLLDWAYLEQKSGQNTMKEWSDHKIKAIFELSTLENPYRDSLIGLIYEF